MAAAEAEAASMMSQVMQACTLEEPTKLSALVG
jgi:hypothetical protein